MAVVVLDRAARDSHAHVAQVGRHLGEVAVRVLCDGPRGQRFLGRVEVGAHDPRGRDADAEKALDELGALCPLVVVAHDPPRSGAEGATQEHGDEGDGQGHGGTQHAEDENDPQARPAPLDGLHRLGLAGGGEQGAQGDDDQVDGNHDAGLRALRGDRAVDAQWCREVSGQQTGQDGNDPSAERGNDARDESLDDCLEALAQGEGDDHEDRRDQDDQAFDQADGQDQDLADELEL